MEPTQLNVIKIHCDAHQYSDWHVITAPGQRKADKPNSTYKRRVFCKCLHCGDIRIASLQSNTMTI